MDRERMDGERMDGERMDGEPMVRSSGGAATGRRHAQLLRRGRLLEATTLAWNVVAVVVLAGAALGARSVALVGFGLDSLVEIGASAVVLWELAGTGQQRQRRALTLIRVAFVALACYLAVQSAVVLLLQFHPRHSPVGIGWTAVTALCMFALAAGKRVVGTALANPVLIHEASVTVVDGLLAMAVLVGLALNAVLGWWWADPLAALVIVYYAVREARSIGADLRASRARPAVGPALR